MHDLTIYLGNEESENTGSSNQFVLTLNALCLYY